MNMVISRRFADFGMSNLQTAQLAPVSHSAVTSYCREKPSSPDNHRFHGAELRCLSTVSVLALLPCGNAGNCEHTASQRNTAQRDDDQHRSSTQGRGSAAVV